MDKKPMIQSFRIGNRVFQRPLIPAPTVGEPHYAEDDQLSAPKIPKWTIPVRGSLQDTILIAVGRRNYQVKSRHATEEEAIDIAHAEKKTLDYIAENSLPLEDGSSKYPREWVMHCVQVCSTLRRDGKPMTLKALISYINNVNKMQQWLAYYARKTGKLVRRADYIEQEDKNFL